MLDEHRHRGQRHDRGRQQVIRQKRVQEGALAALELAKHRDVQALLVQTRAQLPQTTLAG